MLEFMRLRQPQGEQDCKLLIFIPSATGGTEEPKIAQNTWKVSYNSREYVEAILSDIGEDKIIR